MINITVNATITILVLISPYDSYQITINMNTLLLV